MLTRSYDRFKGIEPHRETQQYLDTVEILKAEVAQNGLRSPQTAQILQQLRNLSVEMIDTNPFAIANKSGTLEKIKNQMRRRIGNDSAKQSFSVFWSQEHLARAGWLNEIAFYDQNIKPLIETNYFRSIGETSDFVDDFWRIDTWFILLFAIEFLLRTYRLHRRNKGVSWIDTMLWRWYDIFLLLPFWQVLRIIPLIVRLHQSRLINLERIQLQINRGIAANFAADLTEVVVIRVINQIQQTIKKVDIGRLLSESSNRPYIDINNVNEVEEITNLFINITAYKVIPKIQPDIEALLRHSIETFFSQSPAYQGLQQIPGVGHLPNQLVNQLVSNLSESTYKALIDALEDPVGAELTGRLLQNFNNTFLSEIQTQHTAPHIQALLVDLLEELKLNYVQRLSDEDLEAILEQTRQLRRLQGT